MPCFSLPVPQPPFYSTDVHEMYDQILHGELYIPEFVGPNATDILSKACLPGVLVQWEMFALHQFSPPDLGAFHRCPLQCQNKSFF